MPVVVVATVQRHRVGVAFNQDGFNLHLLRVGRAVVGQTAALRIDVARQHLLQLLGRLAQRAHAQAF